jgi:hypothetical protein
LREGSEGLSQLPARPALNWPVSLALAVNLRIFKLQKILLAIILILFFSGAASAISPEPRPKLCNVFFDSDLVVHARVVKTEKVIDEDDPEGAPSLRYYFDVIKVYRGKTKKNLVVISESGPEQVQLTVNNEYIVFASKFRNGVLKIWNSWGEVQGEKGEIYSKDMDSKIQHLLKVKTSSIEGEVRDRHWNLISGAILTVAGNGITQTVTVDKNGYFFVKVDPGTYDVQIPDFLRVTAHSPDGMSPDPNNDKVEPQTLVAGQCMQLQLEKRE